MANKLIVGSGGLSLLLLIFLLTGWCSSLPQEALTHRSPPHKCTISLGSGFSSVGVHQFYDACSWGTVIELTDGGAATAWLENNHSTPPPVTGEHLEIIQKTSENQTLLRSWMPAGQRVVLGVKLHPDRMTEADWQSLPGIGESLAKRIESDRQKYGDFGRTEALLRVSGIGEGSLKSWNSFF